MALNPDIDQSARIDAMLEGGGAVDTDQSARIDAILNAGPPELMAEEEEEEVFDQQAAGIDAMLNAAPTPAPQPDIQPDTQQEPGFMGGAMDPIWDFASTPEPTPVGGGTMVNLEPGAMVDVPAWQDEEEDVGPIAAPLQGPERVPEDLPNPNGTINISPYKDLNRLAFVHNEQMSNANSDQLALANSAFADEVLAAVYQDALMPSFDREYYKLIKAGHDAELEKSKEKLSGSKFTRKYHEKYSVSDAADKLEEAEDKFQDEHGDTLLAQSSAYAKFAFDSVMNGLRANGLPNDLLREVENRYNRNKGVFEELSGEGMIYMADKVKRRTARTYAQILSSPTIALTAPLGLAVAFGAGRARAEGDLHDNPMFMVQKIRENMGLYNTGSAESMTYAAHNMAGSSYQPASWRADKDVSAGIDTMESFKNISKMAGLGLMSGALSTAYRSVAVGGAAWASPDGDSMAVRLNAPDIVHILDPVRLVPWQKGLKKHIKKKIREMAPTFHGFMPLKKARAKYFESAPPVDEIYDYLKDYAAVSYSDATDGRFSEYLEGYAPIPAPEGGWAMEEALVLALKNHNDDVSSLYLDEHADETWTARDGSKHFNYQKPISRALAQTFVDKTGQMGFDRGMTTPPTTPPQKYYEEALELVVNRRMAAHAKAGRVGRGGDPVRQLQIVKEYDGVTSGIHSTVLDEFLHNMGLMLGPHEMVKMAIGAAAGARKYAIPSMIPGAEVGGMFSADDLDLDGLLEAYGMTHEDAVEMWSSAPGFMILTLATLTVPAGKLGTKVVLGARPGAKSLGKLAMDIRNGVSPSKAASNFSENVGAGFAAAEAELGMVKGKIKSAVKNMVKLAKEDSGVTSPSEGTVTSVKNIANEHRVKSQEATERGDASSAGEHNRIAEHMEAAGELLQEQRAEQHKATEGADTARESITPTGESTVGRMTLDQATSDPGKPVQRFDTKANYSSRGEALGAGENPTFTRKRAEIVSAVNKDKASQKAQKDAGNKKYVSPGKRAYSLALKRYANSKGYKRVTSKFLREEVAGNKQAIVESFVQDGVVDGRVYAELMPEASNSTITNHVLRAERSRVSQIRAEFHKNIEAVAELRRVDVAEVYGDIHVQTVAEDFARLGVTDRSMYASLGLNDGQIRGYIRTAKQNVQMPVNKPNQFGKGVIEPPDLVPSMEAVRSKSHIGALAFGIVRTVGGRGTANIMRERIKSATGRSPAVKAGIVGEATLLATFEFMQHPFAAMNFPSWIGDGLKYIYHNSTPSVLGGESNMWFNMADALLSPSSKMSPDAYRALMHAEGKASVRSFDIKALTSRIKDMDAAEGVAVANEALAGVGLHESQIGSLRSLIGDWGTLTAVEINNLANALLNIRDGATILDPSTHTMVKLSDYVTMEYQLQDGTWVDAYGSTDKVKVMRDDVKVIKEEIDTINTEKTELRDKIVAAETAAQEAGSVPADVAPMKARVDELVAAEKALIDKSNAAKDSIKQEIDSFGSAQDVLQMVDGKVTGVKAIRYNAKEGVTGDFVDTVIGIANAFVKPTQTMVMEIMGQAAMGERNARLSIAKATHPVVSIVDANGNIVREIAKFKNHEEAAAFAKKINEKGDGTNAAQVTNRSVARGESAIVGNRDVEFSGHDVVAKTAGYMSQFFTKGAVLDKVYSILTKLNEAHKSNDPKAVKSYISSMNIIFDSMVKSFPDHVLDTLPKKVDRNNPVAMLQALIDKAGSKEGLPHSASATGSGRYFNPRLWGEVLNWEVKKDFFASYAHSQTKVMNDMTKRTEHYRLMNILRDQGLILTQFEIENTPGLNSKDFVDMNVLAGKAGGLIAPIDGALISTGVAAKFLQQKAALDALDPAAPWPKMRSLSRFAKRAAVVAIVNGTMARNFLGGILVQSLMSEHPATMKYTKAAYKAIDALREGRPVDPVFRDIIERMGGLGRAVAELGLDVEAKALAKTKTDYIADMLEGGAGVWLGNIVDGVQGFGKDARRYYNRASVELAKILSGDSVYAQKFSENLNLVGMTGNANIPGTPGNRPPIAPPLSAKAGLKKVMRGADALQKRGGVVYGTIDDVLRAAYAYEMVRAGKLTIADAVSGAMKTFYDYPDIPPLAQSLRDVVSFAGVPFIGYELWSAKAFGNYFARNPVRAGVLGAFANAQQNATKMTLKLGQAYSDEYPDEVLLPAIVETRSSGSTRKKLINKEGVNEFEADRTTGALAFKMENWGMGFSNQYLNRTFADIFDNGGEHGVVGSAAAALKAAVESYTGILESAGKPASELGNSYTRERASAKSLQDTLEGEKPMWYQRQADNIVAGLDWALDASLGVGGTIVSDFRGAAKMISAQKGEAFGGQDRGWLETLTNFAGLAMRVLDPRLAENHNGRGQGMVKDLEAKMDEFNRMTSDEVNRHGPKLLMARKIAIINLLNKYESADNIFKGKKTLGSMKTRENILTIMRAMLDAYPDAKDARRWEAYLRQ